MISLVAAMSRNRVIGNHGKLPWGKTMQDDIQRYLEIIDGRTIIMGANTYSGADHSRDKSNVVVLSRRELDLPKNVRQVRSVEDILEISEHEEVIITGGGQVFSLMLEHADRVYLTIVEEDFDGDVLFPEVDEQSWVAIEKSSHSKNENNAYDYSFVTYEKR